ncbi:hypothetical protein [Moraxella caviae]|uniref:hypothetical protein n=1 Tax=Moraxella caviae TaxID=34060 RepID=UPI00117F8209|nr:hypothetical protein [Moraxella caviae]
MRDVIKFLMDKFGQDKDKKYRKEYGEFYQPLFQLLHNKSDYVANNGIALVLDSLPNPNLLSRAHVNAKNVVPLECMPAPDEQPQDDKDTNPPQMD